MKGKMLIFAPLCLLLCWMLPVGSKKISYISSPQKANEIIPLSMAKDAVDDMYLGCNKTMMTMVKDKYFKEEHKGAFAKLWKKAQSCANRKLEHEDRGDEALTKDHKQAICVYTSDDLKFYEKFNEAVRTNKSIYGTSFPYHSLHFWLTSAIQILNNNKNCLITYRRTNTKFSGNVNQIIRFGFFASSSREPNLTNFGKTTCFKIKTCSGAFLKKYPRLKDKEQEVLIPPYEKFNITKKMEKKKQFVEHLSDCEIVYDLRSAGVQSNLDCDVARLPTK
ncbi:ecto-ADP-ribosyltransferase 5-like [Enoplosus armatus]|uniref:ecto-ADP-ribosyltransferase 5-like n=1 Tax=Enoplosus armatus TaxID=215367 RepID=UPI003991C13F